MSVWSNGSSECSPPCYLKNITCQICSVHVINIIGNKLVVGNDDVRTINYLKNKKIIK